MAPRPRGTGSIRKRNGWYTIKYYIDGVPMREAAHTQSLDAAQALLNKRLGQIASGKVPSPRRERVRLSELLDDYLVDMKLNNRRDQKHPARHVKRLRAAFGNRRAVGIRSEDVQRYVLDRRAAGLANASINRELACLRRVFSLALEHEKIDHAPKIKMLALPAPRSGFFERERFDAVLRQLRRPHLEVIHDMALVGYWLGWRVGEIIALEHRQVDLARKCLVLEPGKTKGGEGRIVYPPAEAWAVIEKWHRRRALRGKISARLFHRNGRPVKTVRRAWRTACTKAGQPAMLFHDLRRTAARNMVRAGIPESVVMRVTGHRTRAIFERYNIVSDEDMQAVPEKLSGRADGRTKDAKENQGA